MTIEAKLADGTTLQFPDGTDPAVIQATVQRIIADKSATAQPDIVAQRADINRDVGALEAGLIGAGRGLTKIGRAVGLVEPEATAVTQAFQELKEQRPVSTFVGEVAGESAPFLVPGLGVGAIPAIGARTAATVGLGAIEGGLISRGEGRGTGEQIATAGLGGLIAGAFELAMPRISRVGRQAIRRVLNKAPDGAVIDATGKPTAEFLRAIRAEGKSFDDVVLQVNEELIDEGFNPEQLARKSFLESQDLAPTRAQVTRNAADFQAQQEAAKTSSRVRDALEGQEAVLTTRFNNAVLDTGGRPVTPTSTVTDSIVGKATVLDQEISDLYTAARAAAPGDKAVKFNSLAKKLRELAPANRRSGGNVEAIVGELQSKGVLDKDMKLVGRIGVETAEDVRAFMNSLHDPQNGFGNGLLRQLKESLDEDVFKAAGQDIFNDARSAKRAFEQELSRAKISKFDSLKTNLVRDVLENKIDPERFGESVVFGKKYRAADLKQLKDYISADDAGANAFNDLRAEALESIKNRAFIGPEDAAGNKALSRDKLEKALASIGEGKLSVLFTPEERGFFRDMMAVAKMREPVRGTALGRGPSAQAIGRIEQKLRDIPVLGSIVSLIDVDASGRAVLKGSAQRTPAAIGPSAPRQAIAQAAAIGGVSALPEDNQQQGL